MREKKTKRKIERKGKRNSFNERRINLFVMQKIIYVPTYAYDYIISETSGPI